MYPLGEQVVRLTQIGLLTRNPDLGTNYSFSLNLALATHFYRAIMIRAPEADQGIAEQLKLWVKGRIKPTPDDFTKFRSIVERAIEAGDRG